MLKISIVTITKNSERFLRSTIQSVIMQKGINEQYQLEHIFVYAPSEDDTLNIILEYQNDYPGRIKLIHEKEAIGISHAMNLGIEAATGDIINHLHSDDSYQHDHVLLTVTNAFETNPEFYWLYSGYRLIDHNNVFQKFQLCEIFYYPELFNRSVVPHPTVFIKKSLFEKYGSFDISYKCAMDYDLWFRIGNDNQPIIINDYLVNIRNGIYSTSNVLSELTGDEAQSLRQKYVSVINKEIDAIKDVQNFGFNKKYFSDVFYRMAQIYNKKQINDKKRALKCLSLSIRLNPYVMKRYIYYLFIYFSNNYQW